MDPFTQRMLERAKVRRDKLDIQKMELEQMPSTDSCNLSSKRKSFSKISNKENASENTKERELISSTRKSKLQKLANFYSDTEENLPLENRNVEQDQIFNISGKKQQSKSDRLLELASKIKQWDDDSNHFCNNLRNSNKELHQMAVAEIKNEKEITWDKGLVNKLCSQGYTMFPTQSKLIYDFEGKKHDPTEIIPGRNKKRFNDNSGLSDPKINESKTENSITLRKEKKYILTGPTALFEEAAAIRVKDPAELSLAERRALFEKKSEKVFSKNYAELSKNCVPVEEHSRKSNGSEKSKKYLTSDVSGSDFARDDNCESTKETKLVLKKMPDFVEGLDENLHLPKDEFCSTVAMPQLPLSPNILQISSDILPNENVERSKEGCSSTGGRLYPSLSNLDITEESEPFSSEAESLNESQNSNFCLNLTLSDLLDLNKNNPITPPHEDSFSKSTEWHDLQKVDMVQEKNLRGLWSEQEIEDEALSCPSQMIKSSSFKYANNFDKDASLMHTVSFYRKKQLTSNIPSETNIEAAHKNNLKEEVNETILVESKIESLIAEVNKQQTIISQASQALNLCVSTVEFSGSGEQVEGERLLLLATHKRQACLNEIQRLKVENSVWPQGDNNVFAEKGDVALADIKLKLKRDALRALAAAENLLYFVCLIKSDEHVFATSAVSATSDNLKDLFLSFPGRIKLEGLRSNFKITVEVYSLELGKELLPHDVKYHIVNKKEKRLLTPIKIKKPDSKLIRPNVQSPAGPNAVRTSIFQMCGYVVFSLKEITRTQWILNKVPYVSPLEGTISMRTSSELRLDDEFRGFLTMFDDISGFGAWHRRWCLLSSHVISYWKYPDDEQKKVPNGTIDLKSVITENVGLVSRDICARLNTFLLESTRARSAEDKNSLVLTVKDDVTTIRHLLSADSKQEMVAWCKKINTTLGLLRSWKCNARE